MPHILPRIRDPVRTYYEPFLGGGAVFFAMAAQNRFERAVVSDKNPHLVNLYRVVQSDVDSLKTCLTQHAAKATDSDWFYYVRSWDPAQLDPVEGAARLLYLNRTCFNGLYRVNRDGAFNVPFGRYKNPRILDPMKLEAASRALQGVELRCGDFEEVVESAGRGDAVYFDPPYVPVSATASFTGYQSGGFGPEAQERLVEVYARCWRQGAAAVLSNSDCEWTRHLYRGLDVTVVQAARVINSAGARRGPVNELLVVGPVRRSGRRGAARARAKPAGLDPVVRKSTTWMT